MGYSSTIKAASTRGIVARAGRYGGTYAHNKKEGERFV